MVIFDWGDACVSHPFLTLAVTLRFAAQKTGHAEDDGAIVALRDAYLEPWGTGLNEAFAVALGVGAFAHAIAWIRQRDALPKHARPRFDEGFSIVLRRAVAQTLE